MPRKDAGRAIFHALGVRISGVTRVDDGFDELGRGERSGMFWRTHASQTYQGLLQIALFGLRTLVVLNGGALLAVLVYLANSDLVPSTQIIVPVAILVGGIILAGAATLLACLIQVKAFAHARDAMYGSGRTRRRRWLATAAVALAMLSLAAFAVGAIWAATILMTSTGGDSASGPMSV